MEGVSSDCKYTCEGFFFLCSLGLFHFAVYFLLFPSPRPPRQEDSGSVLTPLHEFRGLLRAAGRRTPSLQLLLAFAFQNFKLFKLLPTSGGGERRGFSI